MFLLMKLLKIFLLESWLFIAGKAGEQENVNETVKYGETWHQHNGGRVLGCGWRGEMFRCFCESLAERWTEPGMMYFLQNEELKNPRILKITCFSWCFFFLVWQMIMFDLFPARPEESYYLPKELVQQLSSWKDATSLVNGSLWLWRKTVTKPSVYVDGVDGFQKEKVRNSCWWIKSCKPVEVGSWNPIIYKVFLHPRWCRTSSINSSCVPLLLVTDKRLSSLSMFSSSPGNSQ